MKETNPQKTLIDKEDVWRFFAALKEQQYDISEISDGFHTFAELYDIRKAYNAALFNEWAAFDIPKYDVHKSWRHNDGELCFDGGWFIVSANLPEGQISNHYQAEDWQLFNIPFRERAMFKFDGHSSSDCIKRLLNLNNYLR